MKKRMALFCALISIVLPLFSLFGCNRIKNVNTRYEITAEYVPENRTVAGAVKVTFENDTANELSMLKFQIYPNAYRKNALYNPVPASQKSSAYYAGESYGEMVISSVNGGKNWEIMGEDEDVLCVFLERPLFPEEKVVLDIGFIAKLAAVNHRTGVTESGVNLGYFFPLLCGMKRGGFLETPTYAVGEPFYHDFADYKLTLTLPKEYGIATSGEIVAERMLESKKVYTVSLTNAQSLALFLSEKQKVAQKEVGETTLFYTYDTDKQPEETLAFLADCFAYYTQTFGAYPYDTYTVAQTKLSTPTMDMPALTLYAESLNETQNRRALARAVARQWWYVAVRSDAIENAWQSEGLSEFSAALFFEEREKYGLTKEALVREALIEYRSYYDVYGSVLGRTDTRMTRHLKDFVNEYEYRCIALLKPTVMLDTLQKSVGDKKFFSALRRYYTTNRLKNVSVGSLIAAFESTGADVSGFFDSFISGKAVL